VKNQEKSESSEDEDEESYYDEVDFCHHDFRGKDERGRF
jgi:hypothetical protein